MLTTTDDGARLFWEMHGESGEPLVLVHGSWVDAHRFDPVLPALVRSFRVLVYDRRGHSRSRTPDSCASLDREVADLAAVMEAAAVAPAHVIASSSGASIALHLAARRPELFRSLVLQEPPLVGLIAAEPGGPEIVAAVRDRLGAVAALLEQGKMRDGARQFVETVVFGPGAWAEIPPELKTTVVANAASFRDEMRDPNYFSIEPAALTRLAQPMLVTNGDASPPFLQAVADKLVATLPRARRHVFAGTGHEPEQTHPEDFVETVQDFIAEGAGVRV